MPISTDNTLATKWWNRDKPESEWTAQPPSEAVPPDATATPTVDTTTPAAATTPDYTGGIETFLRAPQNTQDAQQLLSGLQNFVRTGGSQIDPALRKKVDDQINALMSYEIGRAHV